MATRTDRLSADVIRAALHTQFVGHSITCLESVDSTNRMAKEMALTGVPEGALVIAESQRQGRGRLGRQWLAPPGTSLLMSLILRPRLTPIHSTRVTMVCALAVADAVERTTGLEARIKWPNDILLRGRKAGGILAELGVSNQELRFVIVGIGLNVNVDFDARLAQYPADAAPDTSQASLRELAMRSTSISRELGHDVSRLILLRNLLSSIERRYVALSAGHVPNQEWSERLETLGQEITVTADTEVFTGKAESVDDDGALFVRLPNGVLRRVLAGDVTLRSSSEI